MSQESYINACLSLYSRKYTMCNATHTAKIVDEHCNTVPLAGNTPVRR
jgi:hypothetical protein